MKHCRSPREHGASCADSGSFPKCHMSCTCTCVGRSRIWLCLSPGGAEGTGRFEPRNAKPIGTTTPQAPPPLGSASLLDKSALYLGFTPIQTEHPLGHKCLPSTCLGWPLKHTHSHMCMKHMCTQWELHNHTHGYPYVCAYTHVHIHTRAHTTTPTYPCVLTHTTAMFPGAWDGVTEQPPHLNQGSLCAGAVRELAVWPCWGT